MITAEVYSAATVSDDYDIRSVGLWPGGKILQDWTTYLDRSGATGPAEYCVQQTAEGAIVQMRHQGHVDEITQWTLSAAHNYQPTKCELVYQGSIVRSTRVTYLTTPAGEQFMQGAESIGEDGTLISRVSVNRARVNDPLLPSAFSPRDLGVGNGINIRFKRGHPRHNHGEVFMYCDGDLLSPAQYNECWLNGDVLPCKRVTDCVPMLLDEHRTILSRLGRSEPPLTDTVSAVKSDTAGPAPATQPSMGEWERYTRAFIDHYRLDDAQRQRALQVLRECQERAHTHMTRIQNEFELLSKREEAVKRDASATAAQGMEEITTARGELLKPIGLIFERELKPRLERLPTRAQRATAGDQPDRDATSSRPAP